MTSRLACARGRKTYTVPYERDASFFDGMGSPRCLECRGYNRHAQSWQY
jgi:hypothetical protein